MKLDTLVHTVSVLIFTASCGLVVKETNHSLLLATQREGRLVSETFFSSSQANGSFEAWKRCLLIWGYTTVDTSIELRSAETAQAELDYILREWNNIWSARVPPGSPSATLSARSPGVSALREVMLYQEDESNPGGPVVRRITSLLKRLSDPNGYTKVEVESRFEFSATEMHKFVQILDFADRVDAFSRENIRSTTGLQNQSLNRIGGYMREYLRAYFRNGRVIDAKVDLKGLEERVKASLGSAGIEVEEGEIIKILERLKGLRINNSKVIVLEAEDGGFVSRDGRTLAFETIKFDLALEAEGGPSLQVSEVDAPRISGEIIEVVTEAIGDALFGVPGAAKSTVVGKLNEERLLFDPEGPVTSEELAQVSARSGRAAGMAENLVGGLVRGASWTALNNEVLASGLESLAGSAARKASEKVWWCYASVTDQDPASASTAGGGDVGRLNLGTTSLIVRPGF